jgi:hypothetical protein
MDRPLEVTSCFFTTLASKKPIFLSMDETCAEFLRQFKSEEDATFFKQKVTSSTPFFSNEPGTVRI